MEKFIVPEKNQLPFYGIDLKSIYVKEVLSTRQNIIFKQTFLRLLASNDYH